MRASVLRSCRIGTGILVGTVLLASCQSGVRRVAKPASAVVPVAVPVVPENQDGERINQWGGIVPDAAPAVPVEDSGLGELEPQ
jgi:hypothetical protein